MYKSKFTYFGQTGLNLILGVCALVAILTIIFRINEIPVKEKLFLVYGSPFILFVVVFLWRKILVEVNSVDLTESEIILTNILTRRTKVLAKECLTGYRDTFRHGYTILLIDKNDKVAAKIHEHYYRQFPVLIENLGLIYLGRVPDFWDKLFRKKKKVTTH